MINLIQLHQQNGRGVAPECEIWVNPAHIIAVEPLGESALIRIVGATIATVESYDWVLDKLTGRKPIL